MRNASNWYNCTDTTTNVATPVLCRQAQSKWELWLRYQITIHHMIWYVFDARRQHEASNIGFSVGFLTLMEYLSCLRTGLGWSKRVLIMHWSSKWLYHVKYWEALGFVCRSMMSRFAILVNYSRHIFNYVLVWVMFSFDMLESTWARVNIPWQKKC